MKYLVLLALVLFAGCKQTATAPSPTLFDLSVEHKSVTSGGKTTGYAVIHRYSCTHFKGSLKHSTCEALATSESSLFTVEYDSFCAPCR